MAGPVLLGHPSHSAEKGSSPTGSYSKAEETKPGERQFCSDYLSMLPLGTSALSLPPLQSWAVPPRESIPQLPEGILASPAPLCCYPQVSLERESARQSVSEGATCTSGQPGAISCPACRISVLWTRKTSAPSVAAASLPQVSVPERLNSIVCWLLEQRSDFPLPLPRSLWGAEQEQTSCETVINIPTSQKKKGGWAPSPGSLLRRQPGSGRAGCQPGASCPQETSPALPIFSRSDS